MLCSCISCHVPNNNPTQKFLVIALKKRAFWRVCGLSAVAKERGQEEGGWLQVIMEN
jgi:hypothetical protein